MNAIKFFILCSGIIFAHPTLAMKALEKKQAKVNEISKTTQSLKSNAQGPISIANELGSRRLIILFDPKLEEKDVPCGGNAALTDSLARALLDQQPILITPGLLQNAKNCTPSSLRNWEIYKTTQEQAASYMLLLIRNNSPYLEKLDIYSIGGQYKNRQNEVKKISDGEHLLGLKIGNCTKVTDALLSNQGESLPDLTEHLRQILITHQDIKEWREDYLNRWDIFLQGHGTMNTIAGMPRHSFETMLNFLNFGINTRSLFYLTCYSGGRNLIAPYKYENRDNIQYKDFNYMIICANAFNTLTWSGGEIVLSGAFDKYFDTLDNYFKSPKDKNLFDIFEHLGTASETIFKMDTSLKITQLPTIRFPHAAHFSIVDLSKGSKSLQGLLKVFTINDEAIIKASKSTNKELKVPKDTHLVFLESPYIPVEVIFDSPLPKIISRVQDCFFKQIHINSHFVLPNFKTSFISKMQELKDDMVGDNNFYIENISDWNYKHFYDVKIDLALEKFQSIERRDSDLMCSSFIDQKLTYCTGSSDYLSQFINAQKKLWNASKLPLDVKEEFPNTRSSSSSNSSEKQEVESPVFNLKPRKKT